MNIRYTDQGKGNPVILIHGFCESKEMWRAFEKELSLRYRVLCPDLPGFGESPLQEENINLEEVAVLMQEWMEELGIEGAVVIGHSLGGYVALAMAELMGNRLKGLGLFHSTAFSDDEEKIKIRNRTITFVKKYGVETFVTSFIPQLFPEHHRTDLAETIQEIVEMAKNTSLNGLVAFTKAMRDRKDRSQVLGEFAGRKLFIAGTLDGAVPLASSRRQKNMVDDYHEISDCGHMGMFEKEKETLEVVDNFLKSAFV
ncbi:alpha/beta fold hydrolase [Pararhodonellum marinum]|uniref:alpha/beta fold hydrolase n=1 Tax=Pararhodonellum marinum TaxID=2755358 RepID=UPI0018907746|nr:alpha/beta hydrolase [Pararhodonellum marinum]